MEPIYECYKASFVNAYRDKADGQDGARELMLNDTSMKDRDWSLQIVSFATLGERSSKLVQFHLVSGWPELPAAG